MAIYHVSLSELPNVVRSAALAKRDATLKAMRTSVRVHGPRIAIEEVRRSKPRPPFNTGYYQRAFKSQDLPNGVLFFNQASYAGVIEGGRRAGARMPPVSVIARWVTQKGIARGKEARSIAFVIARKIAKQGWPAPPYGPMQVVRRVADRLKSFVAADIRIAIGAE